MLHKAERFDRRKLTMAGILVAMGVVYGDIGTSPLYVMKAIVGDNGGLARVSESFILGSVSLISWTLTILTMIKYVVIALNTDNHEEGGIFSFYTLIRKKSKYLIIPAMIGGAALLADGVLTPAMTMTTAIEGLRGILAFFERFGNDQTIVVAITLTIISILFSVRRLETELVGEAFGPIMSMQFIFLGIIGLMNFSQDWTAIRALDPYYASQLLVSPENKLGLFVLGNIFLATTGVGALYSDLGYVGKMNIRISWPYVKVRLILNYLGQAAWLLMVRENPEMQALAEINPFLRMIPRGIFVFGVVFATIAAVIASQALISGSYTLVSEAIKLKLLPRPKIIYPGSSIGQMYIPAVNLILWLACSAIVLASRTSTRMEAAHGLSITITMLMTTILLLFYLLDKIPVWSVYLISSFFAVIEVTFFFSSAAKFFHGGYVTAGMAVFLLCIMIIQERGNEIKEATAEQVSLEKYIPQLKTLKEDTSVPMYQTNAVFLTSDRVNGEINRNIIYSTLDKQPKRASAYWFANAQVTDEPFTQEYSTDMLGTSFIVQVQLYLGFHISQEVNVYLRQIVHDLTKISHLPKQP